MLRTQKGMSQEELARAVGYQGKSAIWKVEQGERDISQTMVKKYADALGVSVTYLMTGEEASGIDEMLETLRTRPEMRILFSTAKTATKEDIERAVTIIEALKNNNG